MTYLKRHRWPLRTTVASAFAAWFALSSSAGVYAATLVRLSTDPYTNSTSQHQTEVEPDTLSFGSTIVSAFQVGRFFDGGASNIGFATSTDGGASWTNGFLPKTTVFASPAGIWSRASDPAVAFDPKHGNWVISYLGLAPNGSSLSVVDVADSTSKDGIHWSNPVFINNDHHFNDKNWSVCDTTPTSPFFGNCYTEFDDFTQGDLELMSTSTDGGQTWGPSLAVSNGVHGIGGQPIVQPNGNVVVPFVGFSAVKFLLKVFSSSDGGASWVFGRTIAPIFFRHPAGGIRAGIPLPSAEIDAAGTVYVTWSDCRFEKSCSSSDLLLTSSPDGLNWTHPTRIPADPIGSGVDHFIPGLGVDRSTSGSGAHLVAAFYYYPVANCTSATCALQVGYTASADGGASWSRTAQLAGPMSLSWLPNTTQGRMVGDYISTSFSGGVAYPAFAVANPPSGTTFDEAIYTVAGGVSATGSATAATDQDSSTSNATDSSSTDTAQ